MVKTVLICCLIALAALGAVLLILSLIEPHKLNVTRDTLALPSSDKNAPTDLRIFYFSDLHAEFCFIPAEKLINIIRDEYIQSGLDIVAFGGDIINDPKKISVGAGYLRKIKGVCDELNIPFIGVTGNHDVEIPSEGISSCAFLRLDHEIIYLQSHVDGRPIAISGTEDSGRRNRVWYRPHLVEKEVKSHILFAHNPDYILTLNDNDNVDFMISGHIHGGQIRTPFKIEFTSLRKDALPKQGVIAGKYMIGRRILYISKGIGCVKLPMRLGAVPEVNIIDIKI